MPAGPLQKILVRQVNWLGDAIMTLPALESLRAAYPTAHIAVWSERKLADLWRHVPTINETLIFSGGLAGFKDAFRIRRKAFEVALIFPNSTRAALEMFLAGIPRRIGYGGNGRNLLLHHVVPRPPDYQRMHKRTVEEIKQLVTNPPLSGQVEPGGSHHTLHYLHLVKELGPTGGLIPPRLNVSEQPQAEFSRKFLSTSSSGLLLYAGLNPGAEYGSAKRWPLDRYAAAAVALHQRTRCRWIIFGGPGDVTAAAQLEKEIHARLGQRDSETVVTNVAGRTSLGQLIAGLKMCSVVLTNDSGPMHVAVAVGTPVVVPFGSTSPALTGPSYGDRGKQVVLRAPVPCAPCFLRTCPIDLRCLSGITVEMVVRAALQFLAAGATGSD